MQRFIVRARRAAHRAELCLTTWPVIHSAAFMVTRWENRFWRAVSEVAPTKWVSARCVETAVQLIEWEEILEE